MKKHYLLHPLPAVLWVLLAVMLVLYSCSKSSSDTTPPNPCAGVTISVSTTVRDADAGAANGTITATASGGSGIMFSINNGTPQSSGNFTGLAAGTYTVTAKNASGCSGTASATIKSMNDCVSGTPGPTFTAVKGVISANCAVSGCHNGTQSPNFTIDCNIVAYADLIKQRAVDQAGTPSQMPRPPRPALAQADRDKITAWIAAGKHFTD